MANSELTPKEKAAVLLISLGSEYSAQLYKHMTEDEITDMTLSITMMRRVDKDTRDEVVDEFYDMCIAQQYISGGGLDYARDILERVVGPEQADYLINQLSSDLHVRPFEFVQKAAPSQIFNMIHNEHPQTIALVLSYMRPKQSAEIISALDPELQTEIISRIADMGSTSPDYVRAAEQVLERKVMSMGYDDQMTAGGIDTIVDIINSLDRASEKRILEMLDESNAELSEQIRQNLFMFADIAKLNNSTIQRILKEIDNADLATALKMASDEIKHIIFSNISKRLAEMIQDDMEVMGPVRVRDVEDAQQRIVAVIRQLEESNEITIARGEEDALIV
ncbi:MAG: flagellar motor switch protein FliG [Oscillospiraceae bacterium]|nr:flagellar motor switch protein FliG [Oscillospiraceae bacterium]